jgi:uncharacterized protein (DUF885 family)
MRPLILAFLSFTLGAATPHKSLLPIERMNQYFKAYWEHTLQVSPETATFVGDPRYNDRLSDNSLAAIRKELAWQRGFLAKVKAVPARDLNDEEASTSRELLILQMEDTLEGARFREWEQPFTQMGGLHIDFPQLFSSHPFKTAKDFEDYVARLRAFGKAMDDSVANARRGLAQKRLPPRLVVEQVIGQVKPLAMGNEARAPFLEPLKKMPDSFPKSDVDRLSENVNRAITEVVTPAYERLLTFLEKDYLPATKTEPGLWSQSDGVAHYRYLARHHTTTTMDPKRIHEIGLKEVARIDGEMEQIAKRLNFKDLPGFRAAVVKDTKLHPRDGDDLVARYKAFVDGMRPELSKLFGRLPKADLIVVPTEAFREQGAAAADYNQGTPDGSRPGRFNVNTYKAQDRTTLTIESTAYHEALPGHHLQISIAQELEGLPEFRKFTGPTAYAEGWALYSERLPKELGFYKDPYSDYGRLNDEMLRAIRLVVDTGVHHLKWSRAQMVDFFRAHGSMDEVDIQSETDRYIANPGQALAYKIGQLKILELREKAKSELGSRFVISSFHDEVLGGGALPLSLLERRIQRWLSIGKALGPRDDQSPKAKR